MWYAVEHEGLGGLLESYAFIEPFGKGYGKRIMLYAIEAAKEHFDAKQIDIEAQEYAKGFYESVGFRQSSETFMLDGIPHIKMTLRLPKIRSIFLDELQVLPMLG